MFPVGVYKYIKFYCSPVSADEPSNISTSSTEATTIVEQDLSDIAPRDEEPMEEVPQEVAPQQQEVAPEMPQTAEKKPAPAPEEVPLEEAPVQTAPQEVAPPQEVTPRETQGPAQKAPLFVRPLVTDMELPEGSVAK